MNSFFLSTLWSKQIINKFLLNGRLINMNLTQNLNNKEEKKNKVLQQFEQKNLFHFMRGYEQKK